MSIPTKSLDDMIREIKASLQAGERRQPAYTLLVGSGFSFPIIPTPSEMLGGDIAWWRYGKARGFTAKFCNRPEGITSGLATESDVVEFERKFWKDVHATDTTAFTLTATGLPDLTDPRAMGPAYHAAMTRGLLSNKMRRQYLRDAIDRSYPRVNGAHIFLASILEAQEKWDWGVPFCRTIFTTNFDPLLQRSLQLVNKLYYMSDRPDVLEPPDDSESDAIHLVYTHGSVHRYDLLNTAEQIEQARKRNAPTLIDYFRRHGVIVIGYSGWADTTMEALASCPSFDSNLYWCDIHPAADADARLRPEVLKVLEAREKNAFYVPITGADEAMRLLHSELDLGPVPKFILEPVSTMIGQLKSIKVLEPAVTARTEMTPLAPTLATLLEDALTRLEVAKSAFDDPSIVRPESAHDQKGVAKALIAQLLSDAYVAYSQGKHDQAIALWSTVVATKGVPAKDRARALFNRGYLLGQGGDPTKEIADYTAILEMPDAPPELIAQALNNRGVTLRTCGETTKAIADYIAVLEMPDASAEQKATALNNRGIALRKCGEMAKGLADYAAVLEMADAPPEQKATAFINRGWDLFAELDDVQAMIEDSKKALEIMDDNLYARANLGVGLLLTGEAEAARAEYETLLSRTSDPAVIGEAISDLEAALQKRPPIPEAAPILERLRAALPNSP